MLQAQMLDGDALDAGAFGEVGFASSRVGIGTDLRLGPPSRPLPYRLPPPSSG